MRGYKNRLKRIEEEVGEDSIEIKLKDGGEFYANQKDLLTGYVEAVEWMVGKIDREDVSEKTMKFLKAKKDQDKPCDLIRETLKNAKAGKGIKKRMN